MTDYVKPELLILIPVLLGIGTALKGSAADNRLIPLILGIVGIVLTGLWTFGTAMPADSSALMLAIFSIITQGIIVAAVAVYGNQIVKQLGDKLEGDGSTTISGTDSGEGK